MYLIYCNPYKSNEMHYECIDLNEGDSVDQIILNVNRTIV